MLWTYQPVWQTGLIERLEWRTDIIESQDGSEQRIALCQTPRRTLEFTFLVADKQRTELEAKLWANGSKSWDVPVWTDKTYSTTALMAGSSLVPVSTVNRDFHVGGKVLLQDKYSTLVATISAINPAYLILTSALPDDFELETEVTPIRVGYLDLSQQVTRFTGDAIYDVIRFQFDDISDCIPEATLATYRGHPVYEHKSDWVSDLTTNYSRKTEVLDFGGRIYRDDLTGLPKLTQSYYWTLQSRQQIQDFRCFLYARRGRLAACWLPSFLPDLSLSLPIGSASLQINIEHTSYTALYQLNKNRRDIRIELVDGSIFYRRITACAEINTQTERLTLDSSLGVNVAVEDIEVISFMVFSRLEADAIEFAWQWADLVNVKANWVSTNDDV